MDSGHDGRRADAQERGNLLRGVEAGHRASLACPVGHIAGYPSDQNAVNAGYSLFNLQYTLMSPCFQACAGKETKKFSFIFYRQRNCITLLSNLPFRDVGHMHTLR